MPVPDNDRWLFIVKAILTISSAGAFIWGFIVGRVSTEVFVPVVISVFTYIFCEKRKG
jgi:hypothetical protein